MCCFLHSSYCQEFLPVYFRLKFPKPRDYKMVAEMKENHYFILKNLPWYFLQPNLFSGGPFCSLFYEHPCCLERKVKAVLAFISSLYGCCLIVADYRQNVSATQPGQLPFPALRSLLQKELFYRLRKDLKIQGNIVCVTAKVFDDLWVAHSDHSNILSLAIFQIATVFPEN